ncbi:PadR family transcriptional regulator [Janibacter cremeus]|uniref:DNA-binding PadR family transcriptional regulator n=1 Tax=Janibacter cremeus TaxID=1285192 RepID=A0A852VQQ3_9MICO|nr:DNA-binding PadR family transcriptional regulator [Janibacter cremeus]
MRRREMLEFAVLGLLHESPLHGYELRRRLNSRLGAFRALSFGTLYPCLAGLQGRNLVSVDHDEPTTGRRQRITYTLTDEGRAAFAALADRSDPGSWEDDAFDVRVAFFARTEREVRLRILEGRRTRLAERLAAMRSEHPTGERADRWTDALRTHGEDSTERALAWIEDLIDTERQTPRVRPGSLTDPAHPAFNPPRNQPPTKENP